MKPRTKLEFDAYLFSQPNNSFFGNLILEINGKARKIGNFNLLAGVDFDLAKDCLTKGRVGIKLSRVQQLPEIISGKKISSVKKVARNEEVQEDREVRRKACSERKVFRKSRRFR